MNLGVVYGLEDNIEYVDIFGRNNIEYWEKLLRYNPNRQNLRHCNVINQEIIVPLESEVKVEEIIGYTVSDRFSTFSQDIGYEHMGKTIKEKKCTKITIKYDIEDFVESIDKDNLEALMERLSEKLRKVKLTSVDINNINNESEEI